MGPQCFAVDKNPPKDLYESGLPLYFGPIITLSSELFGFHSLWTVSWFHWHMSVLCLVTESILTSNVVKYQNQYHIMLCSTMFNDPSDPTSTIHLLREVDEGKFEALSRVLPREGHVWSQSIHWACPDWFEKWRPLVPCNQFDLFVVQDFRTLHVRQRKTQDIALSGWKTSRSVQWDPRSNSYEVFGERNVPA